MQTNTYFPTRPRGLRRTDSSVALPIAISVQPRDNWWKMAAFLKKDGSTKPLPARRVGCHVASEVIPWNGNPGMRCEPRARPDI